MSWKPIWKLMSENVQITVRAIDENGDYKKFTFDCYVSKEINGYDRLDNLSDIAHHLALLRNYYQGEIIDVKEQTK